MSLFSNIPAVKYQGPAGKDPMSFCYYNPDESILGKPMREYLKFSLAWWHALCGEGADMFGPGTADKSFGASKGDWLAHAKAKADAGFELMQKLSIDYFCFHDTDIVAEADTLAESNQRLDAITDYIRQKMGETGKKCLWGTCNAFSHKRFMTGAGTSPDPDIFAYAAAKIKKAIELTVKLGGTGYVFWGGREGYETLLNTNVKLELDNLARLMRMAIDYARSIGFKGDFYIEPKPKEPSKHQYDFDVATACNFLRTYGLLGDVKMNVEANHATLASHTFSHELRMAADYARSIGFAGDFYIEPKPKEPSKHQYDFDVAAACNFLRTYDLLGTFKMNVEANHATLAGHTFQHELRAAAINGAFGSIDANQGDLLLGWDTDQFPSDVLDATWCMYEVLKAGGFTNGGLNFDAKTRRMSYTHEDILHGFITGMDTYALGLRKAAAIVEDGRVDDFVRQRYASWGDGIGADILAGKAGMKELAVYAAAHEPEPPASGRQEMLEGLVNRILYK